MARANGIGDAGSQGTGFLTTGSHVPTRCGRIGAADIPDRFWEQRAARLAPAPRAGWHAYGCNGTVDISDGAPLGSRVTRPARMQRQRGESKQ